MDDRLKQSISALMDDEANELELQRVLSQIDDAEVSETWDHYHRISDVIKNDSSASINIDISEKVALAIRSESDPMIHANEAKPAVNEPHVSPINNTGNKVTERTFLKHWFAAAASIALVIGMSVQSGMYDDQATENLSASVNIANENVSEYVKAGYPSPVAQVDQIGQSTSSATALLDQPIVISELNEAQARQLGRYLLRHAEHAVRGTQSGFVPLARIASVNSVGI